MFVFGFGIALVTPNVVAIVGFVMLVVTIEVQVRVVEEPYLSATHGDPTATTLLASGASSPGSGSAAEAPTPSLDLS